MMTKKTGANMVVNTGAMTDITKTGTTTTNPSAIGKYPPTSNHHPMASNLIRTPTLTTAVWVEVGGISTTILQTKTGEPGLAIDMDMVLGKGGGGTTLGVRGVKTV